MVIKVEDNVISIYKNDKAKFPVWRITSSPYAEELEVTMVGGHEHMTILNIRPRLSSTIILEATPDEEWIEGRK